MILTTVTPVLATANEAAVWFLVRHAEKEATGSNPHLSSAGSQRAGQLATLLSGAGIEAVLSSDYHRTRQTAAPLARRLDVEIEMYDPSDMPALAATLRERGGRVLVVGHSNTTPELAELLGGEAGAEIDEPGEYDRLYVLTRQPGGPVSTVLLRYGKPFRRMREHMSRDGRY